MLLAGIKSKQPAKALPPSITAIYPVCHAACKKTASPPPARTKARKARRLGLSHSPKCRLHNGSPTPLLAKEQQGRCTAPAAGRQPLRGQKPSPVGRAEDMPVCLFAQGPFASAEYLVQLTSSLAQKVCLARGSPCPPGEWLKSHPFNQQEKEHDHRRVHQPFRHRIPPHKRRLPSHRRTPDQ